MADYPISKEAVVRELIELRDRLGGHFAKEVLNMALARLGGFPQMDTVPVVHARWEYSFGSYSTPKCSCCGWHIPYSEDSVLDARNYCHNCGAKMDGGAENG